MVLRKSWDLTEAAILLDGLLQVRNYGKNRQDVICNISSRLRNSATKAGLPVDDQFRNTNGITLQLSSLEYVFTKGEKGLHKPTKLFVDIVDIYNTNREKYNMLLMEDSSKMVKTNKNVKAQLNIWLKQSVKILKNSNEEYNFYTNIFDKLDEFCLKNIDISFYDIVDMLNVRMIFSLGEVFTKLYGFSNQDLEKAKNKYNTFILVKKQAIAKLVSKKRITINVEELKNKITESDNIADTVGDIFESVDVESAEAVDINMSVSETNTDVELSQILPKDINIIQYDAAQEIENEFYDAYRGKVAAAKLEDMVDLLLEINKYCIEKDIFQYNNITALNNLVVDVFRNVLSKSENFRREHKFELGRMAGACNLLNEYCQEHKPIIDHQVKLQSEEGIAYAEQEIKDESVHVTTYDIPIIEEHKVNEEVISYGNNTLDEQNITSDDFNKVNFRNRYGIEKDFGTAKIELIGLQNREYNVLSRNHITTINDLLALCELDLYNFGGLGTKSINNILDNIVRIKNETEQGYSMPEELPVNVAFRKRYGIEKDFGETRINLLGLQNRELHVLCRKHIFTINDLLELSESDLLNFDGLGTKSINNILDTVARIKDSVEIYLNGTKSHPMQKVGSAKQMLDEETIKLSVKFNLTEDYSYVPISEMKFSPRVCNVLKREYIVTLEQLLSKSIDDLKKMNNMGATSLENIISVLQDYFKVYTEQEIVDDLQKYEAKLLSFKGRYADLSVKHFVEVFALTSKSEQEWCADILKNLGQDLYVRDLTLDILGANNCKSYGEFLNWCDFDIETIKNDRLSVLEKLDSKFLEILMQREKGMTLADVGASFGLTRERVRQLEKKAVSKLQQVIHRGKYDLIALVHAIRGGDKVLQRYEVENHIGKELTNIYWLYYKNIDARNKLYYFDKQIESFVFDGDVNKNEQGEVDILSYMPDVIADMDYSKIIREVMARFGVTKEFIVLQMEKVYKHDGVFWHRKKLTRGFCFEYLLKNAFPQGFKVGDEAYYEALRRHYQYYFGVELDGYTDHAIDARIGDLGVLCDRGTYIHKDNLNYDSTVLDNIKAYIESYEELEVPYSDIFDDLKSILCQANITNRFMLQGIIKLEGLNYDSNRDNIIKSELLHNISVNVIDNDVEELNPLVENIKQVIIYKFANGYKLNSGIQFKKFCKEYYAKYEIEFPYNADELVTVLKAIGIEDEGVIVLPELLMNDELAGKIFDFIKEHFSNNRNFVFYSVIIEAFNNEITPLLRDETILGKCLKIFNNRFSYPYSVRSRCIAKSKELKLSVKDEVCNALINAGRPLTREEIYQMVSNLPSGKVEEVFIKPFCRTNANGVFFHIDILGLDESDIQAMANVLNKELANIRYTTTTRIVARLKAEIPNVMEKCEQLSDLGIKNTLAYYLYEDFYFNGNIICCKDIKLSSEKLFSDFARNNENFTFNDLTELKTELNTNINFEAIFEFAFRINKDEYLSLKFAQFDVEATDDVLDDYCSGDFMSIYSVKHFGTFPDAGFKWTPYLLEQYVWHFSKKYKLIHDRFNEASCVGAIVKKEAQGYDNFSDIMAVALAESTTDLTRDAAMEYLKAEGYITSTRIGNIENLIERAKLLREKVD